MNSLTLFDSHTIKVSALEQMPSGMFHRNIVVTDIDDNQFQIKIFCESEIFAEVQQKEQINEQ